MFNEANASSESRYSPLWWWMPQAWTAQIAPQSLTQPIQPGWTFGNVINVKIGRAHV